MQVVRTHFIQSLEHTKSLFGQDIHIKKKMEEHIIYSAYHNISIEMKILQETISDTKFPQLVEIAKEYHEEIYQIKLEAFKKAVMKGELKKHSTEDYLDLFYIFITGVMETVKVFKYDNARLKYLVHSYVDSIE